MKFFNKDNDGRYKTHYLNVSTSLRNIQYQQLEHWGFDPNNKEESIINLFHGAAAKDQLDFVKEGIKAGIPLDIVNSQGYTLFTTAARSGASQTVGFLLNELGLDPTDDNLENGMRYNALHAACAGGKFSTFKELLMYASELPSIDVKEPAEEQSPLQTAICSYQFGCVNQIIWQLKPDLHHVDFRGRTPLATALSCYVYEEFDKIRNDPEKLQQLENLCLYLVENEDPFMPYSSKAKPAYLVINTCEIAVEQPSGTPLPQRIEAEKIVKCIMITAPKLAVTLLKKAQQRSEGEYQSAFIKVYNSAARTVTEETNAKLKAFM